MTTSAARTAADRLARRGIVVAALLGMLVPRVEGMVDRTERLQACFISLNEPNEVQVFRSHLDPEKFAFIDIRPPQDSQGGARSDASESSWILEACTPELRCDLVVISGEFAGDFFGTQGSLRLQELEEASCQRRCAGLFHQPREVFLLGCNTLATKDQDSRTPETYLRVLMEHGFERARAERVVELRYGPLGPSFRESLRRIFAGVPHLYGFGSIAPRAKHTAPMLERYLHVTPDYAGALGRRSTRNMALRAAFAGTSLTEMTGLLPVEAGAKDHDHICAFYDESRSLVERLQIAYGLALRPDALHFIPTLQMFLSRNPPHSFATIERSIFLEIHAVDATHGAVLELIRTLDVSALQLELAHFATLVGWIEGAELHALAVAGAVRLLRASLTSEAVDVICEIVKYESLRNDVDVDDLSPQIYTDPEGLRLVACLAPADPRISARVLQSLRESDPVTRQWAAHALTQLRPSNPAVLAELVPYLRDPSPEIAARIRWLFEVQTPLPPAVLRAMEEIDRIPPREGAASPRSGTRLAPTGSL